MPIIDMLPNDREEYPEGAYCSLHWSRDREFDQKLGRWIKVIVLADTHKGLCLVERERNMHDDSDFYMTVWNEEKGIPEEIMFATTRGWSYPCMGSRVDATPEVRAKYEAWQEDERLRWVELKRQSDIARDAKRLVDCQITETQLAALNANLIPEAVTAICDLLEKEPRLRNDFKKKMAVRVREWLADPAPKYPTPLSKKQMSFVYQWAEPQGRRWA